VIDDVVSLNKEEDIHRTQIVKILNQTANSGWKIASGSKKDIAMLANYGSVEGLVLDESKYGGKVDKIQPNVLPTGLFAMSQQYEQDVKRVSGMDDASQGYNTGKVESGKAIDLKTKQNQMSAEMVFDNFYHTLELFGNYLLDVIRKNDIYTDEEIKAVVNESSLVSKEMLMKAQAKLESVIGAGLPEPMPPEAFDPNIMQMVRPEDQPAVFAQVKDGIESAQEYAKAYPGLKQKWDEVIKYQAVLMLLEELKTDRLCDYGIKVTVSPTAPTERLARFYEMDALQSKYGNLIPPDVFIDATDLPNKEEIKAKVQQAQQMGAVA